MNEVLSRYTQYEIGMGILFIAILLISFVIASHFLTKDRRVVWTVLSSQIVSLVLTTITLIISRLAFNIFLSDRHILLAVISLIIVSINITILFGEYNLHLKKKYFDIDHVTRAHFSSTMNSTIIISLVILSLMIFVSTDLKVMFGIFTIPTILSIWATHFLSRKFLIDEQ